MQNPHDNRYELSYGESAHDMYGPGVSGVPPLHHHHHHQHHLKRTAEEAGLSLEHSPNLGMGLGGDSHSACVPGGNGDHATMDKCSSSAQSGPQQKKTPPPNGKKTKGRVKIKMEFIDNKLRRYTTFSKRKTGIMKKAYELSTLTGTQVMLLVASETGHVYTFATRKLQPMITSEAGKALIQTCLNSPDPLPSSGASQHDQRMSATGFEETELTYTINDDEQKDALSPKSEDCMSDLGDGPSDDTGGSRSNGVMRAAMTPSPASSSPGASPSPTLTQLLNVPPTTKTSGNEFILGPATSLASATDGSATMTVVPTSHAFTSGSGNIPGSSTANASLPGLMYQTAQGVVYATPNSGSLSDGLIFNLGQGAGNSGSSQHFITIPVPVSLTSSAQAGSVNHPVLSSATDLSKSRK